MKNSLVWENAYKEAGEWVKEHGIPSGFVNISDDSTKGVFAAINDFGILSEEEKIVYNKIVFNRIENIVWYQGGSKEVAGYSDIEISGVKKFMAHCYVEQGKRMRGGRK